jgi:uncharacterized protein YutE (UPF0331/DUF86 family)
VLHVAFERIHDSVRIAADDLDHDAPDADDDNSRPLLSGIEFGVRHRLRSMARCRGPATLTGRPWQPTLP